MNFLKLIKNSSKRDGMTSCFPCLCTADNPQWFVLLAIKPKFCLFQFLYAGPCSQWILSWGYIRRYGSTSSIIIYKFYSTAMVSTSSHVCSSCVYKIKQSYNLIFLLSGYIAVLKQVLLLIETSIIMGAFLVQYFYRWERVCYVIESYRQNNLLWHTHSIKIKFCYV